MEVQRTLAVALAAAVAVTKGTIINPPKHRPSQLVIYFTISTEKPEEASSGFA